MKKNLTEIVFILDCSGSMHGLEDDTVGGFNAMLDEQKQQPGQALVSTVLFNDRTRVLHDRLPLKTIRPMRRRDCRVSGTTALNDAVGQAIRHISRIHQHTAAEERPGHTLFVITTDGLENASRFYSRKEVCAMIRRQKERYGWEFLFLGANIDAVETARNLGIEAEYAVNYRSDSKGTALGYEAISEAVSEVRIGQHPGSRWRKRIDQDFQARAHPGRSLRAKRTAGGSRSTPIDSSTER